MYITPVESVLFFYDLVANSDGRRYADLEWLKIVAGEGGLFKISYTREHIVVAWYKDGRVTFAERLRAVEKWARWAR